MMKKKNLPKTIKNVLVDNLKKVCYISLLCCYSCESKEKTIPTTNNPPEPHELDEKILTIVDELKNIEGKDFDHLLDEYIEEHPEDKDYCVENKGSIKFMFDLQNPPSSQTPPSPPPQPIPQENEEKNKEIVNELKDKELEDKIEKIKEQKPEERKKFVDENKEKIKEEYKKQQEEKKKICPKCKKNPCECTKEEKDSKEKELNDLVDSIDNEYKARDYVKPRYINDNRLDIDQKIKEVKEFIDEYIYIRPMQELSKKLNAQNVDHLEFDIDNELNTIAKKIKEQNPNLDKSEILYELKSIIYDNSTLFSPICNGYDDGIRHKGYNNYKEMYDRCFDVFVKDLDTFIGNNISAYDEVTCISFSANPNLFKNFKREDIVKKILENTKKQQLLGFPSEYVNDSYSSYTFHSNDGHNWVKAQDIPNDFLSKSRLFDSCYHGNIYDRATNSYYKLKIGDEWLKNFWNKVKWNDEQGCFETIP